jgi:hypothetical protein
MKKTVITFFPSKQPSQSPGWPRFANHWYNITLYTLVQHFTDRRHLYCTISSNVSVHWADTVLLQLARDKCGRGWPVCSRCSADSSSSPSHTAVPVRPTQQFQSVPNSSSSPSHTAVPVRPEQQFQSVPHSSTSPSQIAALHIYRFSASLWTTFEKLYWQRYRC